MTSGPTYGQGFIELEPQLSRDFLAKINTQLDRAFSNIKLDVDDTSLRAVRSQLEQVEGSADRAAREVATIAREAGDADTHLRELAGHLGISEDAARRMATELLESQRSADRLEDSALQAARALGVSEDEAKRFASAMAKVDDSDVAVRRLEGSLGRIRSSLSTMAVSAVAFFGVRGIVGAATAARDSFIDLGESINAVEVVFGDGADTIFAFSEQVAQSAGLAKSEFQQMSTVLGAALQNAGLGADEAAQKTITLTQRAADLASVFNTDVSEALGAIQAALRGEGDPIERFGVSLSAAAVDAEAAALGYSRVAGEFDNTAKAAARISLIMEQTNRVAGDFANTSDSLANRQRIAAAEMENVRAELGEALLPMFEALVDIGPELVEGFKDLTPALAALAQSAAGLVESTPGVLDFMDALHLVTDLPRGFGQLFDGIKLGLSTIIPGLGQADEAIQSMLERRDTQGLIDDLREGGDAATVLANRLADVGKKGKLTPEFIRNLREIAGTDLAESASVLGALVENAERLGLSADEVAMLNVEFARLRNEILPVGNEIAQAARAMLELPEVVVPEVVTALDGVRIAAGEAGLSMGDLVAGVDPVARALLDSLTPAEQLALKMEALAAGTATAAEAFAIDLQPSLIDVQEGLKDLNADGQVSLTEFTESLETAAQDFLDFMVDIAAIAAISPELARALKDLGPEAAGFIADGFAKADEAAILEAAENLIGSPEQIAEAMQGIYQAGLESVDGGDPAAIQAWLGFVQDTFEADLPGITEIMAEVFQPSIDAAIDGLDPPDLNPILASAIERIRDDERGGELGEKFDGIFEMIKGTVNVDFSEQGDYSGRTYFGGFIDYVESQQAEAKLREAIGGTLSNAIYQDSPPKLFLDAGIASGDAFWSGFREVEARTVVIPPIEVPEVVIPPIEIPEIPPIVVPDVVIPDIELPRVVLPEVLLPKIEIPPIDVPDVEIPDIIIAEVVLSEVLLPEIAVPDVVLPRVLIPDIDLPEFDLTGIGIEAGASLISGFTSSAGNGGMDLRVAILRSLDMALDRKSPPKLFLEAGRDSGDAFWSGFGDVAAPTLVIPPIDVPEIPPIEVPDVEIPDVVMPDIVLSDVVVLPDLVIPEMVLPEISVPDVILPEIILSDVTLPDLAFPDVTLPDIAISDVVLPEIILSDVVLPDLVVPDVILPDITLPQVEMPDFDLTDIGADAGSTLISGITAGAGSGAGDLRSSILDVLNTALDRHSPSKLFRDAGIEAGEGFWVGFTGVAMDFPKLDLSKSFASTRAVTIDTPDGASGVAPAIGEVNIYNPTGEPSEESLQEAGLRVAVMQNLRKNR